MHLIGIIFDVSIGGIPSHQTQINEEKICALSRKRIANDWLNNHIEHSSSIGFVFVLKLSSYVVFNTISNIINNFFLFFQFDNINLIYYFNEKLLTHIAHQRQ